MIHNKYTRLDLFFILVFIDDFNKYMVSVFGENIKESLLMNYGEVRKCNIFLTKYQSRTILNKHID